MLLLSFAVYLTAYFGLLTAGFFLLTYFANRHKLTDPIAKKLPFVSFVVPVFNEQEAIKETIKSLLNIDYPKNKIEIIVIDDGSTDKTYAAAKKFQELYKNIVKVYTKENGGCANALNFGIRKAKGEIIVRFDADTLIARDALKKMVGYFENPKVMAVTSSLNVNNHKGFLQKIQWSEYIFGIFLRKVFCLNNAIHVIPGPLSIYKAEFFRKYGGFDERNITEDTEMAMRIQSHGYEIRNSISANVYTNVPVTFRALLKQRIRWYTGFFHNSWDYRHLYRAKRKTNLSSFIMPCALISIFLTFFTFFILAYYTFKDISNEIIKISVTGFSLSQTLSKINWHNISELISNYATSQYIFFLILGGLLMIVGFLISKYYSGEKRGIGLAILYYFLFYIFFFVIWWGGAVIYFVTGIKQKWGKRTYCRGKMKQL